MLKGWLWPNPENKDCEPEVVFPPNANEGADGVVVVVLKLPNVPKLLAVVVAGAPNPLNPPVTKL